MSVMEFACFAYFLLHNTLRRGMIRSYGSRRTYISMSIAGATKGLPCGYFFDKLNAHTKKVWASLFSIHKIPDPDKHCSHAWAISS